MKTVRVEHHADRRVVISHCYVAESFFDRVIGLMGRSSLPSGYGMWLEPCNSIHTFFMRFPIDVLYLSKHLSNRYQILKIHRHVKPWRIDRPVFQASAVLEISADTSKDLKEGDFLCLS